MYVSNHLKPSNTAKGVPEAEQLHRGEAVRKHRPDRAGAVVPERRLRHLPAAPVQERAARRHELRARQGKERVRKVRNGTVGRKDRGGGAKDYTVPARS